MQCQTDVLEVLSTLHAARFTVTARSYLWEENEDEYQYYNENRDEFGKRESPRF